MPVKLCVGVMLEKNCLCFNCLVYEFNICLVSSMKEQQSVCVEWWYVQHVYLGFSLGEESLFITQHETIHPVSVAACKTTNTPIAAPRTVVVVVVLHSCLVVCGGLLKYVVGIVLSKWLLIATCKVDGDALLAVKISEPFSLVAICNWSWVALLLVTVK